jgi:hypothetical protein
MWKWIVAAGLASIGAPAAAQNDTDCSALPTQAERDACYANQAARAEDNGQPAAEGGSNTVTEADVDSAKPPPGQSEEPDRPKLH